MAIAQPLRSGVNFPVHNNNSRSNNNNNNNNNSNNNASNNDSETYNAYADYDGYTHSYEQYMQHEAPHLKEVTEYQKSLNRRIDKQIIFRYV